MHEFYFLCRQFRWELAYRIVSALLTTFLAQGLSRMNDGTAMLTATTAFRNEPA